jgi:hypothetical protein
MNISNIGGSVRTNVKEHSGIILSIFAGIGTLTTAYLAAKASYDAAGMIRLANEEREPIFDTKTRLKENTKLVWKLYIPAGISAASTITCIIGANRIEAKKTIAAQTAFAISQRVYSEYKDKVIEELGAHKDQSVRDKLAEDKVKKNPPPSKDVLITGPGVVLCCELYTGRYFTSDMEKLRKAQNDLNSRLLKHDYATLNDFYYLIELHQTSISGDIGWKSDRMMDLMFSTVLTDDGRPCLAFEYNYIVPL